MAQLTPRDDVKKAASEILKRVDQLIKAGEIDHSIREIMRAKEIDPANVYVRAYEERLAFLKEEHEKNAERERTRHEAEQAARERVEQLRKQQEERATLAQTQSHREAEGKVQEKQANSEKGPIIQTTPASPPPVLPEFSSQENVYIKAFKKTWISGNIKPQSSLALEQLGRELGLSPERQLQLELRLHAEPPEEFRPATILVIDDDEKMLSLIARMLSDHEYEVIALTTSDEAYTLLKKWKPRLILCDVNLETSTMGGFSFFEKTRTLGHLHHVPFIFLTGLSDEVLVRTGKELGVDDYLTKPISEQNLVSAIKGKLKRFSELASKPIPGHS